MPAPEVVSDSRAEGDNSRRAFDVFLSYARDPDEPFAERLHADLVERGVRVWWDRAAMESRGKSFLQELRDGIEACERFLFLVRPGSTASEYCRAELEHGLLFAKAVVPLLRAGTFEDGPHELRTLDGVDFGPEREAHYEDSLAELVRRIATRVDPLGKLRNLVPRLPAHFVPRMPKIEELRGHLLADLERPVVVSGAKQVTGLRGGAGTGKSVLATAFARSTDVRRAFADGVVWISVGRTRAAHPTMRQLGAALVAEEDELTANDFADEEDARRNLPELLLEKVSLIVLDDVWELDAVVPLLAAVSVKPQCRVLITTRDAGLVERLGANDVCLDELSHAEAARLLAQTTGQPVSDLPPEARGVIDACGRLPLALAMIAASVGSRPHRWAHQLRRLANHDLDKISRELEGYPHPNLARAIEVSLEALDESDPIESLARRHYADLAVFPRGVPVAPVVLSRLWTADGVDVLDTDDVAQLLVERSLARCDDDGHLTLHDLQRDYATLRTGDVRPLHRQLLDAYRATLPSGGWSSLDLDEPYLWDQLLFHLSKGELRDELRSVASDAAYLGTKAFLRRAYAAVDDIAVARRSFPDDDELEALERVVRQHAHLFAGIRSPRCAVATLTSRLAADERLADVCARARSALPRPYLFPEWPLPDQADPALAMSRRVGSEHNFGPVAAGGGPAAIALAGGSDGAIAILDATTGREVTRLGEHSREVDALEFGAQDRLLASGDHSGQIVLWSTEEWRLERKLSSTGSWVRDLAFDAAGETLVAGGDDTRAHVWDLTTDDDAVAATLAPWENSSPPEGASPGSPPRRVLAVAADTEGRRVACGDETGRIAVLEWRSGTKLHDRSDAGGAVTELRFAGDQLVVGVKSAGFGTRVLSLREDAWVGPAVPPWPLHPMTLWGGLAMDATGERFAVADGRGPVLVFDARTGERTAALRGHERGAGGVAFAPGGRLVSAGDDVIRVWDLDRADREQPAAGAGEWLRSVDFSPAGDELVSGGNQTGARRWRVGRSPELVGTTSCSSTVTCLRFDSTGQRVLFATWDGSVTEWTLATDEQHTLARVTVDHMNAVALHATRRIAVPAGPKTRLEVVELDSGEVHLLDAFGHMENAMSPDGTWIATSDPGARAALWRWEKGTEPRRLVDVAPDCPRSVEAIAFHPDGTRIALGFEGWLALVDLERERTLWQTEGPGGALAFDPRGRLLASRREGEVCIWDATSGALLTELRVDKLVYEIAWSPDGSLIALAGVGGLYLLRYVGGDA